MADETQPRPDVRKSDPEAIVLSILNDAAIRNEVDLAEVRVVDFDFKNWVDGSLECPEEGKTYARAITPGYRIVVEGGGSEVDYRALESGEFWICHEE